MLGMASEIIAGTALVLKIMEGIMLVMSRELLCELCRELQRFLAYCIGKLRYTDAK